MPEQPKIIGILGATGGIGKALTLSLESAGECLALGARDEGRLAELSKTTDPDTPHYYEALDATKFDAVDGFVQNILTKYGRLDGMVNCVGSILIKPAHLTTEEDFNKTIALNLATAMATVKFGAKAMMKSGGGSIVLMSSVAARIGIANHEAIAAAKAGIVGLTLSAAATYASKGIRVNCVCPGLIETPLSEPILRSEQARKISESMHPVHRIGRPSDVTSAIQWLLSSEQSWVTGQVLGIDGGMGSVLSK
ncbi:MAG: SDR family oxidoreductase [Cyanobacteria bacterium]|nr:SDR family oxidoreductase [Cyanobacteriota bacterium]